MFSRYTREFNRIFIDSNPITGMQSIASSYNIPYSNVKFLGQNSNQLNTVPIGPFIGAVNMEAILINSDPFIQYTGDIGANLKIEYGTNEFLANSGYLAEYNFACSVGSIPSLSTKWNVYNTFGSGISTITPFSMDESKLNIVNPGDIEIVFNQLDSEKINSLKINIKSNRLPIFDATSLTPKEVKLQYPLEITTSFSISLNEYKIKNMFDFPNNKHIENFTINLNKHNTIVPVNTFAINNALLIAESYNSDIDGSALAELTYYSTVTR